MGKKLETVKTIGNAVVSIGVGIIVSNIVKENTSEEKGALKKLCIWTGGLVLAGIACDKASQYFNKTFDEIVEGPKKPKNVVDNKNQETD